MKDNISKAKLMVGVPTNGETGKFIMEIGKKDLGMVKESGKELQVIHTKETGSTEKHTVTASTYGKTVRNYTPQS
jgi:hypothetical protein